MAAYASDAVGTGIAGATALLCATPYTFWLTPAPIIPLQSADLLQFLAGGNIGVYSDIYWQFLAYDSGGIDEMRRLYEQGELSPYLYRAWLKIDGGDAAAGNLMLLKYEQQITLQQNHYDQHLGTASTLTGLMTSPIPGDNVTFTDYVPGGNIALFSDRWKWIEGSMYKSWLALQNVAFRSVNADMRNYMLQLYRPNAVEQALDEPVVVGGIQLIE